MLGASKIIILSLFSCLLMTGAVAQQKPQGSKLFPEIFDDNWTPPTRPESKPIEPATKPATPAPVTPKPVTPKPPVVTPPVPNDVPPVKPPTVAPPVETPAPIAVETLLDIPPADQQSNSRKLMREVFAAQLADKTPAGRQKLVVALVAEAERQRDVPVDRYVLLTAVLQASREAGSVAALIEAADQLAGQFKVNALAIQAEVVGQTSFKTADPATTSDNLQAGFALVDRLIAEDDFAGASRVVQAMQTAAATDPAARAALNQRSRDIVSSKASLDRLLQAVERLKTAPEDPAALTTVGCHLCFNKRQWESGLAMLAKSGQPLIKAAALADLQVSDKKDYEAVGDAWWAAAEREVRFQAAMKARAAHYYQLALASAALSGLARTRVEQRLEAVPAEVLRPDAGTVVRVPAGNQWVDVDFQVVEGKCYEIVARGQWTDSNGTAFGPGGLCPAELQSVLGVPVRTSKEAAERYFLGQNPRGALIARIEKNKPGFFVGSGQSFIAPTSATLSLRMNDGDAPSPQRRGQLQVTIREITPRWTDARGETRIVARIDESDTLNFTQDGIFWRYGGNWSRVGEHDGYFPTSVNGILWWPKWANRDQTFPLKATGLVPKSKLTLVRVEAARGTVVVDANAPGEAKLRFNDKGGGSSQVGCVVSMEK